MKEKEPQSSAGFNEDPFEPGSFDGIDFLKKPKRQSEAPKDPSKRKFLKEALFLAASGIATALGTDKIIDLAQEKGKKEKERQKESKQEEDRERVAELKLYIDRQKDIDVNLDWIRVLGINVVLEPDGESYVDASREKLKDINKKMEALSEELRHIFKYITNDGRDGKTKNIKSIYISRHWTEDTSLKSKVINNKQDFENACKEWIITVK